jgi:hypothetical protein
VQTPIPQNPIVNDLAPTDDTLATYDRNHAITYMRMLDADSEAR